MRGKVENFKKNEMLEVVKGKRGDTGRGKRDVRIREKCQRGEKRKKCKKLRAEKGKRRMRGKMENTRNSKMLKVKKGKRRTRGRGNKKRRRGG